MRLLSFCVLLAVSFLPAHAATWTGTIIETITNTDDPRVQIGQQYFGSYTYTSDDVDGIFEDYAYPITGNDTLTGNISVFGIQGEGTPSAFDFGNMNFAYPVTLTVSGGKVVNFFAIHDIGAASYLTFMGTSFWFAGNPDNSSLFSGRQFSSSTRGNLTFSDPTAIPETLNGAAILSAVMLGLVATRGMMRKRRTG